MNKASFRKKAISMVHEGKKTREEYAKLQAEKFIENSSTFDPTVFTRLGSSGVNHFLQAVQDTGVSIGTPPIREAPKLDRRISRRANRALGWAHLRRSEPIWVVRAVIYGASAGLILLSLSVAAIINIDLWSFRNDQRKASFALSFVRADVQFNYSDRVNLFFFDQSHWRSRKQPS